MPKFRIPQSAQKGFLILIGLTPKKLKRLIDSIKKMKPGLAVDDFAKIISKTVNLNNDDAEDIAYMLRGILGLREKILEEEKKMNLDEFIESIIIALQESENKKFKSLSNLKLKLKTIFDSSDRFRLTIKARSLALENEKVFDKSSIITNIRPMLKGSKITNAVLVHSLKISYYEDHTEKEIHFALSNKDLDKLNQQISETKKDENVIKNDLNLSFIDIE